MSGIEPLAVPSSGRGRRAAAIALALAGIGLAGIALAGGSPRPLNDRVAARLEARLPKTKITKIDCAKVEGLCEVTAGANLFYVDAAGRYLVIGRVYDMETRQDLTAARLLELNPDLLVGGAAKANAAGQADEAPGPAAASAPAAPRSISLAPLAKEGAIVWGTASGPPVTIFTDFRCGYCRALSTELAAMNVRVIERPISVLGSRDLANRVYCAADRARALRAAYEDRPVAGAGRCDTSGLDANERFARANGLSGTPVIVRADGAMLEGYRPRAFLERWLKEVRS